MMKADYALTHCSIVDIENNCIQSDMAILVDRTEGQGANNGVISRIEKLSDTDIPKEYRQINLNGNFVMPGLINAHVHLFSSGMPFKNAASVKQQKRIFAMAGTTLGKAVLKKGMMQRVNALLNSGVTTVRCVGDPFYKDVEIRSEIESGQYAGPRIKVSGYMISVSGGHGTPFMALTSDSPWEGRKRARQNIKEEVDFIKICVTGGVVDARCIGEAGRLQMTEEEVAAICDEAHKIGLLVAAHVESTEGVRVALKGGVDTIEHGSVMDEEIIRLYKNNPRSLRGYSAVVPTIAAAIPGYIDSKITGFNNTVLQNSLIVCNGMITSLKQAMDAGIKIGLGTDAAMPYVTHYNTWRELEYAVRYAGITPQQALYHATKSNAEIMGVDNCTGSLEVGKAADLLVLKENPLQNLKALSQPVMVVARGNLIEHPEIKKMDSIEDALNSL